MPESFLHMSLVNYLHNWVLENYQDYSPDWIDLPKFRSRMSQRTINRFVPDFYARNKKNSNQVIVGEAKTPFDLENIHSEEQIASFLHHCKLYEGSIFLLAIPWDYAACARGFIKYLKNKNDLKNVRTVVVDVLGQE